MNMPLQQNEVQREISAGTNSSAALEVEQSWQRKVVSKVVGHHDYAGYMDERDFRLQLVAIREVKEKPFTSGMVEFIENNAHINGKDHAERGFIFGDKKFIEPKSIAKIREILLTPEFGFQQEFVNNSPKDSYIKTKLTYHELLVKYDEKNRPVGGFMFMSTNDKLSCYDLEVAFVGVPELGQKIEKEIAKYTKRRVFLPTFKTARNIIDYGDGPMVTFRDEIMEKDAEVAFESFYPWLKEETGMNIKEYAQAYINSNAPVLLLYGVPGTGKTTLVRTFTKELNAVVCATSNQKFASDSAFIDSYRDLIKKAREDLDPRPYIILFEDMDQMLMSRLNNNRDMARLLNETKGIGSNREIHIIFTTNMTDLSQIDPALLRPGRCFGKLDCRKLTLDQAAVVRKDLGYDVTDLADLAIDGLVTLSEAIDEMRIAQIESKLKAGDLSTSKFVGVPEF